MALYESLTAQSTPDEIASAYKEYTGLVGGDTQAAQEAAVNYLSNLGISAPTITAGYQEYLSPENASHSEPSPVAGHSSAYDYASANQGVDQMYKGINEYFANAAAQNMMPTMSQMQADMATYGLSEDDIKAATGKTLDELNPTLTYHTGKQYEGAQLYNLASQLAKITDTSNISGGVFGEKGAIVGFKYDQAQKLLGTGASAYHQVLLDAAANLIDKGITDLSQLSIKSDADIATARNVVEGDYGQFYAVVPDGGYDGGTTLRALTPEEAARVRTAQFGSGDSEYTQRQVDEITKGNAIVGADGKIHSVGDVLDVGVTYAGPGGTNYQIKFDDQGKPHFYTNGFSTSDAGLISMIAAGASLAFPAAAPFIQGGMAVHNFSEGNTTAGLLNLIGAGTSYYGNELGSMSNPSSAGAVSGLDLASDVATLGSNPALQMQDTLSTLNNARTGVQVYAALEGKDPGALLTSLATTAAGKAVSNTPIGDSGITIGEAVKGAQVLDQIGKGDFGKVLTLSGDLAKSSDLKVAGIGASIFQELNSDNPNMNKIFGYATQLESAVKGAGTKTQASQTGDLGNRTYDETILDAGAKAFIDAKNAGASDADAYAAANAAVDGYQPKAAEDKGPYDAIHSEISGVVPRDILVAGGEGLPENFKPVQANQIQVDANGMPKTIGLMDFGTGKIVPVDIKKDASGGFYYTTPEGTNVGVDASAFERAFYKSNPSEYLRIVNDIYATSGDIDEINRKLAQRGMSPEMAEQVRTIDVQAKDITGKEGTTPETAKSNVSDFLSKLNLKGLMTGDMAEIAGAAGAMKDLPEVARAIANAQDTSYLNDIQNYLTNSSSAEDRQYYKGLAQELVKQNPDLADNSTMQDILSTPDVVMELGDLGTIEIVAPRLPKIDTTYDPNQPIFNPKDENTWPMAEDFNIDDPKTWPKVNVPPETTTQNGATTTKWVDDKTGFESSISVDPVAQTTTKITVDPKTKQPVVTITDNKTGQPVQPDTPTTPDTPTVSPPVTPTVTPPAEPTTPPVTPTVTPPAEPTTPPAEPTTPTTPTTAATPTTPTTAATPTTPTTAATPTVKAASSAAAPAMLAGAGLSSGFDWNIDPRFLKSTVTGGAVDPLAAVKQAQAELERDTMMQNIDPRLMQILQDRMGGQPQAGQGALDQAAPEASNERAYYSYGSEDSIDDILGGAAANYKEGGYVAPLMMNSGGSMALPLLAKSGGALSGYQGRENFKDGKHVAGEGDGQSDDIPAWLADGEFVFPADVVSALGNGSTKAGTDKLYEMMHSIRDRARSTGREDLPPPALKSPLDYLKSSKRSK